MPPIKWRIISTILDEREAPVDKAILSLKELPLQRASVPKSHSLHMTAAASGLM